MNKNILRSKTFWLQVSTFAAALLPPVQAWIASNPVEVLGALAAINTLIRFATKGGVTIFSDGDGGKAGGTTSVLLAIAAAGFLVALPSCTTTTAPDGTVTRAPHAETIRETSTFAQWLYGVFTIEREIRAAEAAEVDSTSSK